MSDKTKIEWTDATWNPITGCSVVSPGCTNCYAMGLAGTRLRNHPSRAGLTNDSRAGPVWNGQVRFNENWLDQPLRWRKPRMIFVCAHGDLFHESVPDEWIDRVFAVMALAPQHTFQVLTKRAERMREYIASANFGEVDRWTKPLLTTMRRAKTGSRFVVEEWPLPNVWLGVSVEDQTRADERIPRLLNTPAAVRFISAEPLLGPVDLTMCTYDGMVRINALTGEGGWPVPHAICGPALDWVIVGGESGRNARDMNPDWARSLRDQCKAADVAFFMKQMAHKAPIPADLMVREMPT